MCHVLIIEDEALVAADIRCVLEGVGATSFAFAATESEARSEARSQRPEVITSDVRLAENGRGPTVVAAIHAEHGYIPVIFITGTPEECHGCPPDQLIAKPIHHGIVAELFQRLAHG